MRGIPSENMSYRSELIPITAAPNLEARWRTLEADASGSFFLSWSWIGPWLQLPHNTAELRIFQCFAGDTLIALAVVHNGVHYRRRVLPSKTVSINDALDGAFNMVIEYNGVLARSGYEAPACEQLMSALSRENWDEFKLSQAPYSIYQAFVALLQKNPALTLIDDAQYGTWIAPLDGIVDIDSIIGKLSKNRRWQIRRSIKEYEKEGVLSIVSAASAEQALEFFERLGLLHTERWNSVGEAGSFAKPTWVEFHRNLIRQAFDRGEIQLLRICCGEREIGYIYNFLWRKQVLMLQSGFAQEASNVLRPGYISHIFAMHLNAQLGNTHYDFLMGDAEYKRVLAEENPPMTSFRIQQPRLRFSLENALIAIKKNLCERFAREKKPANDSANAEVNACVTCVIGSPLFALLRDSIGSAT